MAWVVGLSSGSSERRRSEPKSWLNFDDVAHCRNVESFNAFVEQFLSERGLARAREIETLISEEAFLLAEYLRNEEESWIPRIVAPVQ
jgi:hypothetical protein